MKSTYLRWCGVGACVVLFGWNVQVWAAEGDSGTEDPVVVDSQGYEPAPTYQNTAQAAHDANVAEAYFERTDAELAAVEKERAELATKYGEDSSQVAEKDDEITDLLEDRTGVMEGDIAQMRADGMGWGEIAHALGVHPGVLGLGHTKKSTFGTELAMATATNLKTGNSTGHGQAYGGGPGAKNGNNGHADGKENNGNKGSGHGNSKGSDNGNGKNK